MKESEVKVIAEEHWLWLETLLHKLYVDAFVHGYKHAEKERREK